MTWVQMIRELPIGLINLINDFINNLVSGLYSRSFLFIPMVFLGLSVVSFAFYIIRRVFF